MITKNISNLAKKVLTIYNFILKIVWGKNKKIFLKSQVNDCLNRQKNNLINVEKLLSMLYRESVLNIKSDYA
jgi:hypothetical protein